MPVSYSNSVKKPNLQLDYTQDMILEMEKCKNDFYHFCKYVKIIDPDNGKVTFVPRWYQKEMIDKILANRNFVGLASRQVGKTILTSVIILWFSIFNPHKTIGIVSNKEKSAKNILKIIKSIYEDLPVWLKCGVELYNLTSVLFDNGTEIMVSATSPDAFRGKTLNCLFTDEIGFVPSNIANDFWAANYPTLSASKTSKIIMISTPNGVNNLYHTIFTEAERGENGFAWCKFDYTVIPGRDEEWVRKETKILGETRFNQEHRVVFLGSTNTAIDSKTLEILVTKKEEPILLDLNDNLRVYEKPIKGQQYTIGVDTGKGTGENASVIQVSKVISVNPFKLEQVAVYQDNHTDVYIFSDIVYKTAIYYNEAMVVVENNAEGNTVVSKLWWDYEYENLINESSKRTGLGVRATTKTKPKAVIIMKKLIEDDNLILKDAKTINELTTFVETKNNVFKGKDNMTDDLVSALYWMCYVTEFDVFTEDIVIKSESEDDCPYDFDSIMSLVQKIIWLLALILNLS